MGLYDRDYYRGGQPLFSLRGPRTVIGWLLVVNLLVFIVDHFTATAARSHLRQLSDLLAARPGDLVHPLQWYRFFTYGFVHDPRGFSHIFFNLLTLWFFGREIERLYGWKEFLRFYMLAVSLGGVCWASLSTVAGLPSLTPLVGASGAVTAVFFLFVFKFPHQRIYLLLIPWPIPAWILGGVYLISDLTGAMFGQGNQTAYSVHLTGTALAFLYFRFGWHLGGVGDWFRSWRSRRQRPKLRVHRPEPEAERDDDLGDEDRLMQQADEILAKITREGMGSLTRKERRLLEAASRRAQQRRRANQNVE